MAHIIQLKGGTSTLATSTNPVLHDREIGVETDTNQFKLGDGVTAWNSLPYGGLQGDQGIQGEIGLTGDAGTDGTDGISIIWQGSLATAPLTPSLNWGYYDTVLLKSFIWDGISWEIIAIDGIKGDTGEAGPVGDPFIVGDILMHDGTWVDNVTRVGWYACIAANAGQGCPDLENTFIKGSAPADVGTTGGSNTHTLTEAELPIHSHGIDHDHGAATTGSHKHFEGHRDSSSAPSVAFGNLAQSGNQPSYDFGTLDVSDFNWSYINTQTVSVSVNLPAYSGTGGDTGSGNAHNNEPAYYKLIYIRKCS